MGRPDVARIKRDADIAAAEAERDTAIKRAEAMREAADREGGGRPGARARRDAVAGAQAEAQRDLEIKRAQVPETVKSQQAPADKAYEIQTNIMQQQVVAEAGQDRAGAEDGQIKVQEAEILRREKELIATVLKPAEVERQRIETLAEAEKQRLIIEAEGRAAATRATGRGRGGDHLQEGRGRGEGDEREGRGVPGVEPGGGRRQADDQHAGDGARAGRAAGQRGQDHDRLDRQRGRGRHAQDHGRHDRDGRADPALFETLSGMQMSELLSKVRLIGDKARGPDEKKSGNKKGEDRWHFWSESQHWYGQISTT